MTVSAALGGGKTYSEQESALVVVLSVSVGVNAVGAVGAVDSRHCEDWGGGRSEVSGEEERREKVFLW